MPSPSAKLSTICCFKQKTAYEMRISDWSSDVCSSYLRVALDIRKIQRQIMRQNPVPCLGLRLGNGFVCLRHLLQIVDARGQRIDIALGRADPQHMQDLLRVLGIILVPAIVQGRSEEHTSELQSLMRHSYAVVC